MSNIDLIHRINLLEAQIEDVKHSGHFTDKQVETKLFPLEYELNTLNNHLNLYGISDENYIEGQKMHDYFFQRAGVVSINL